MCGIAGLWRFSGIAEAGLKAQAFAMAEAIATRGPDDAGVWCDLQAGLGLAHVRLAVLDLSSAGHQPMLSNTGRYVIVFNGEIYNHLDLRQELQRDGLLHGPWRGHSDTETLLAAIEAWGIESALQRCVGMFALALWDRYEQCLHLARDRFGEKPLYWGQSGSGTDRAILFGSELAALRAWSGFHNPVHRPTLAQFLRFTAIAAPASIYSGIEQLLPGHLVTIKAPLTSELPMSRPWWCFRSMVDRCLSDPILDISAGLEALETALITAVKQQSMADVPLGSFLSGGIDSSLITALLQAHSSRPVHTFTIGSEVCSFDESPYALAVAAHLGTNHNEVILAASDIQVLIPQLPRMYSEPFADSSQLPTHLVCREARRSGLTVALTGDGGDELFGGYNRYFWGPRFWNRFAWLPWRIRCYIGLLIRSLPPAGWDALGSPLPIHQLGHKAHKLADRLEYVRSSHDLYCSLVSEWRDPTVIMQSNLDGSAIFEHSSPLDWPMPASLSVNSEALMMVIDTLNYLPNNNLTKVDRAAMAASLETRCPFLDHRVAELAWRLPMTMKIRQGEVGRTSKWALRQILSKYVPPELFERPKVGFSIPIGQWLRGPLRDWAEDLLDYRLMLNQGYLQPEPIQTLWRQHLSGRFDHTSKLWTVLMWQAWLAEWG